MILQALRKRIAKAIEKEDIGDLLFFFLIFLAILSMTIAGIVDLISGCP